MYYVYILRNNQGHFYKGISNNPKRRLSEHNANKNPGTRGKGPWQLVHYEKYSSRKKARTQEKYYKTGSGREDLKRIIMLKYSG